MPTSSCPSRVSFPGAAGVHVSPHGANTRKINSLENIMAIKLCHHIKEDGILCKSAALHGRDYCYSHLTFRGRRMRIAQQIRKQAWRLELPALEDLNAVQVAIMQVLDAITGDRIERHDAALVLYGLQQASSNLRGKDHASFEVDPSAENRCLSYDSFEEDFELTEDGAVVQAADSSANQAEVSPTSSSTAGDKDGAPAPGEKIAVERADVTAPSSIIVAKIHAVADDAPADSPASPDLVSVAAPEAPRKPPRGLRPPNAVRQSAEEAAALAKEHEATAEECGRLDGEVKKCRDCGVKMWKRLAQYWEGRDHPDDWLPFSGTMECNDCTYRHLTTLGRHLDELMPDLFLIYMKAQNDGGEDPGEFDAYMLTMAESIAATGQIPDKWVQRVRSWLERDAAEEGDEEESEASA